MAFEHQLTDRFPFRQSIVWEPNPRWMADSNLQRFMHRHQIADYDTLYRKSVADIEWFWQAVLAELDIRFFHPYSRIVDLRDGIAFPRWCVDGKMNIVYNCLDKWMTTEKREQIALRWEDEAGSSGTLTYRELFDAVNRCTGALRQLGLGKGDVIGLYMPMIPELAIAFLAIARLGGIILPLFSGYGATAVYTRLADAGAKALFVADAMVRRGKTIPMKPTADAAADRLPALRHMIVVNKTPATEVAMQAGRDIFWDDFIRRGKAAAEIEQTDAEDTVMLIYTSGTTGKPKGAVHTHCGFPIKAAQDMQQPMDVKPGDILYWMTDMGWMMGPWQVFGTLLIGATMLFYDGAPDYPEADRVWQMVARHRITQLGISPSFIRSQMSHGAPGARNDLSSLKMVASTGSPWDAESWMWLFDQVLNREKPIINYSGGTEISGGILCGNFFKPLKPGAFSGLVPGMDAAVVDEKGNPLRNAVGQLVLRQPWIGMTRGFWNDRQRYLDAYWNTLPGTWVHGDFAVIDDDELWYLLGRSDDTIKVAGKRLGPAEVESIANAHPAVIESAAIGIPDQVKGEAVMVFCVLKPGVPASDAIRQEIIQKIVQELGNPLKPREVKFAHKLPRTRNGKVMHRLIRAAVRGDAPGDTSSLEDPGAVEAIRNAF